MKIISLKNIGKKKLSFSNDKCTSCNSQSGLYFYESKAWIAFLEIPIIPLFKRMVFNHCNNCKSEININKKDWNELYIEKINEYETKLKHNPLDWVSWINYHKVMNRFCKLDEANKNAEQMEHKFKDNVDVIIYLAQYYNNTGQKDYSEKLYNNALKLSPDDVFIKNKIADIYITENKLEEAEKLLIQNNNIIHSSVTDNIFLLADRYFKKSNYKDSYKLYLIMHKIDPGRFNINNYYRNRIKKLENKLNINKSILNKRKIQKGTIPVLISISAIILLIVLIHFLFQAAKIIYIVNRTGNVSTVYINKKEYTISHGEIKFIRLFRNNCKVKTVIKNIPVKEYDIKFNNKFSLKFLNLNRYIFNINGSAVFRWEEIIYSPNNNSNTSNYNQIKNNLQKYLKDYYLYEVFAGDFLIPVKDADFYFQNFPEEILMDSLDTGKKSRFDILYLPVDQTIGLLIKQGFQIDKIMNYLESNIELNPSNSEFAVNYLSFAHQNNKFERVKNFINMKILTNEAYKDQHDIYKNMIISNIIEN